MQHETRSSKPLSFAFAFMSLAIVPFSLKAVGLDLSFSPTKAVYGLKRISGVLSSAYVPGATVFWDYTAPARDEPAPQRDAREECPQIASAGWPAEWIDDLDRAEEVELGCSAQDAEESPIKGVSEVRKEPRKAVERQLVARTASKHTELPIRVHLLAEVLQKNPLDVSLLVPARAAGVDAAALRQVRMTLYESRRRQERQKDLKVLLKFEVPLPSPGVMACPPPPAGQRRA